MKRRGGSTGFVEHGKYLLLGQVHIRCVDNGLATVDQPPNRCDGRGDAEAARQLDLEFESGRARGQRAANHPPQFLEDFLERHLLGTCRAACAALGLFPDGPPCHQTVLPEAFRRQTASHQKMDILRLEDLPGEHGVEYVERMNYLTLRSRTLNSLR